MGSGLGLYRVRVRGIRLGGKGVRFWVCGSQPIALYESKP